MESKNLITGLFFVLANQAFAQNETSPPLVNITFQETGDGFVNMSIVSGNGNRNTAVSANSNPDLGAVFYTTLSPPSDTSSCPEIIGQFPKNVGGLFHRRYPITDIVREAINASEQEGCAYIHQ